MIPRGRSMAGYRGRAPSRPARMATALIFLLFAGVPAGFAAGPAEPQGYRMGAYRAPMPVTLSGATVLSTEAARELWTRKAAHFIDVLPHAPKPKALPKGTIWRDLRRDNIPGSAWLPNVGFGALSPETEAYYRNNLRRITRGDKSAPIVIYCLADCWMSWNAAKRALALGYQRVNWYPEGTDGWLAAGWQLQESRPVPKQ